MHLGWNVNCISFSPLRRNHSFASLSSSSSSSSFDSSCQPSYQRNPPVWYAVVLIQDSQHRHLVSVHRDGTNRMIVEQVMVMEEGHHHYHLHCRHRRRGAMLTKSIAIHASPSKPYDVFVSPRKIPRDVVDQCIACVVTRINVDDADYDRDLRQLRSRIYVSSSLTLFARHLHFRWAVAAEREDGGPACDSCCDYVRLQQAPPCP